MSFANQFLPRAILIPAGRDHDGVRHVAPVRWLDENLPGGWGVVLGQLLDGAPEAWYRRHVDRIDALQGRTPGEFPAARATALALAVGGQFTDLAEQDGGK